MSKENLKLWESVCKTDPNFTKKAKKGAYNFTSIAPMYQAKKATEAFGVQGIGWGVVVGSETFTENTYEQTVILSYDATLFFVVDGVRGEIPIHASEKACYMTNSNYLKIDDEVRKKVVTNAKTKGLSELGVSADVFLGQFDDPNYVNYRAYEEQIEQAEDREAEVTKKTLEFKDWCADEIKAYTAVRSVSALHLIYEKHKISLQNKCSLLGLEPAKYIRHFDKAFKEQHDKLTKEKEKANV